MTPEEEIAQRLMEAIAAPVDLQPAIRQAIIGTLARFGATREAEGRRAALRERDAEWKKALKDGADCWFRRPEEGRTCDHAAALRALLEETGKAAGEAMIDLHWCCFTIGLGVGLMIACMVGVLMR